MQTPAKVPIPFWLVQALLPDVPLRAEQGDPCNQFSLDLKLHDETSSHSIDSVLSLWFLLQPSLESGTFRKDRRFQFRVDQGLASKVLGQSSASSTLADVQSLIEQLVAMKLAMNIRQGDLEFQAVLNLFESAQLRRQNGEIYCDAVAAHNRTSLFLGWLSPLNFDLQQPLFFSREILASVFEQTPLIVDRELCSQLKDHEHRLYLLILAAYQWPGLNWLGTDGLSVEVPLSYIVSDQIPKTELWLRLASSSQALLDLGVLDEIDILAARPQATLDLSVEPMEQRRSGLVLHARLSESFADSLANQNFRNLRNHSESAFDLFQARFSTQKCSEIFLRNWGEDCVGFYQKNLTWIEDFSRSQNMNYFSRFAADFHCNGIRWGLDMVLWEAKLAAYLDEEGKEVPWPETSVVRFWRDLGISAGSDFSQDRDALIHAYVDRPQRIQSLVQYEGASIWPNRCNSKGIPDEVTIKVGGSYPLGGLVNDVSAERASIESYTLKAATFDLGSKIKATIPIANSDLEQKPLREVDSTIESDQSILRKIAEEELLNLKKLDRDQYEQLKKSYFASLESGQKELIADLYQRVGKEMFEKQLHHSLVRFMVDHPNLWRSAPHSSDKLNQLRH